MCLSLADVIIIIIIIIIIKSEKREMNMFVKL